MDSSSFLLLSFSIILPYLIVDLKLCNRTQTPNNHSGYVVLLVIFVPSPNKLSLLKKQEQETIINIHIRDSEDVEELKKKV